MIGWVGALGTISRGRYILLAGLLALAAGVAFVAVVGVHLASDGKTYFQHADILTDRGLDAFLGDRLGWPYLGMVSLVALAKAVFGSGWMAAFIAFNLACLGLSGALLGRLIHRLVEGPWLRLAGLLLLPACADVLTWNRYVASEPLFILMLLAIFSLATEPLSRRRLAALAALLVAVVLWRPTGMVLVGGLVAGTLLLLIARGTERTGAPAPRCWALAGWLCLFPIGALPFAAVMHDPSLWPFGFLKPQLDQVRWGYDVGEIIYGRRETYHGPPGGLGDHLLIILDRWRYEFALWPSAFSLPHKLYNLAFLGPLFGLSLVAVWRWGQGRGPLDDKDRFTVVAGLGTMAFCLMTALLQVEFDWRYRAPALPVFMVTALIGAERLLALRRRA